MQLRRPVAARAAVVSLLRRQYAPSRIDRRYTPAVSARESLKRAREQTQSWEKQEGEHCEVATGTAVQLACGPTLAAALVLPQPKVLAQTQQRLQRADG